MRRIGWLVVAVMLEVMARGTEAGEVTVEGFKFKGQVEDIQWVGGDRQTVLFLTNVHEVFLSRDEGRTWSSLRSSLDALDNVADVRVSKILTSKADENYIFLVGMDGSTSFVSKDLGKTWQATARIGQVSEVVLNPLLKDYVLASTLTEACATKNGDCYKKLHLSKDFGVSWEVLDVYVVQFDWLRRPDDEDHKKSFPEHTILATRYKEHRRTGSQLFGYWDVDVEFVRSDDFFKHTTVLVHGGNRFLFTPKFLFVAQVTPPKENSKEVEVGLQLSSDGTKTFYSGQLPFKLTQHSYTVLDTSENTVFLHVNHGRDGSGFGHVYISDSMGSRFSYSLRDNRRDHKGKCDFEKVAGLEGIYIANYVENTAELEEFMAMREDQVAVDMAHGGDGRARGHHNPEAKIRTVITFDKGGEWSFLRPPKVDAKGTPIKCTSDDCSLHLHGQIDDFGPVYSSESAIGLVMATGNVGKRLSKNIDETNTYLSRDGGLTWEEVRKGSHIYEYGDHGGLIVMADDVHETNKIIYSWRQGLDWTDLKFAETPIAVDNIIIEPSSTSRRFLVYGVENPGEDGERGAMYHIDFTALHERQCQGATNPGATNSDYESWSPSTDSDHLSGTPNQDKCLLGHILTYTRRKQDANCFNAEKFEKKRIGRNCTCTERDYECDFGYMRKANHGPCVRDPDVKDSSLLLPTACPSTGFYTVSNGYRLVAGNTCVGGKQLGPTTYPCSSGLLGVSKHGWLVLFIILCLIIGMGVITYRSKENDDEHNFGTKHFGDGSEPLFEPNLKGKVQRVLYYIGRTATFVYVSAKGLSPYNKVPMMGANNHRPDSAVDVDDDHVLEEDYEKQDHPRRNDDDDDDDEYDFDEDEDHNEAELISAVTMAQPLPHPQKRPPVAIPKLSAPPVAVPSPPENDLFMSKTADGDAV